MRGKNVSVDCCVNRLTHGYVYLKQWKVSKLDLKGWDVIKDEKEYPIPQNWRRVFQRACAVQTDFFEALFGAD